MNVKIPKSKIDNEDVDVGRRLLTETLAVLVHLVIEMGVYR